MMIQSLYAKYLAYPKIIIDSRSLVAGGIFFALKGAQADGNVYAQAALKNGCSFCVVDNKSYHKPTDHRYILVEDCLSTLQQLANYHRRKLDVPVLGITGSNGKTTTKELISTVLSQKYNVWFTQGNYNNHIGVPLTLLAATKEHNFLIVEMGANHPGEIEELCNIADPDYGLITNVGKAHLEGFGSFEGVIQTKTEMYRYIEQKNGHVFLDTSDEILTKKAVSNKVVAYEPSKEEQLMLIPGGTFLSFKYKGETYETQLTGSYNLQNFKAAISIGRYFKVDETKSLTALVNYTPTNKRSQVIKKGTTTVILDAYNANPSSMKEALQNFSEINLENKIAILGDMKELGSYSEVEHQNVVNMLQENGIVTTCVFVGTEFQKCKMPNSFYTFATTNDFIKQLPQFNFDNSCVLIKGSRSMQLEKVNDLL